MDREIIIKELERWSYINGDNMPLKSVAVIPIIADSIIDACSKTLSKANVRQSLPTELMDILTCLTKYKSDGDLEEDAKYLEVIQTDVVMFLKKEKDLRLKNAINEFEKEYKIRIVEYVNVK